MSAGSASKLSFFDGAFFVVAFFVFDLLEDEVANISSAKKKWTLQLSMALPHYFPKYYHKFSNISHT